MPEITGTNKFFKPQFIVTEDEFKKVRSKVGGQSIRGRDVYSFFLTEEEFKSMSPFVCCDGWFTNPVLSYGKGEVIDCKIGISETSLAEYATGHEESAKYLEEIEGGKFVVGGYLWMKDKLQELDLPIREISIWHRLRLKSFKT